MFVDAKAMPQTTGLGSSGSHADDRNAPTHTKATFDHAVVDPTFSSTAMPNTSLMVQQMEPNTVFSGDDGLNTRALVERIIELYREHEGMLAHVRHTKGEMTLRRVQLGAKLYELKALYAKRGRGGRWAGLLGDLGIPRATADRYVRDHEKRTATPQTNLLTEAFPEPTPEAVSAFVKKNAPKLKAVLTTVASIEQFLYELTLALRGL